MVHPFSLRPSPIAPLCGVRQCEQVQAGGILQGEREHCQEAQPVGVPLLGDGDAVHDNGRQRCVNRIHLFQVNGTSCEVVALVCVPLRPSSACGDAWTRNEPAVAYTAKSAQANCELRAIHQLIRRIAVPCRNLNHDDRLVVFSRPPAIVTRPRRYGVHQGSSRGICAIGFPGGQALA